MLGMGRACRIHEGKGLWFMPEGYRASKEGYSAVKRGTSGRV